ncbi:MAG: hypothetical protein LC647_15410, partial [Beggiatoa sp.]|nr:hypothetical protein [Beggiatoa sp.]
MDHDQRPGFPFDAVASRQEAQDLSDRNRTQGFPLPIAERKASEIIWNPEWVPPDSTWVEESKDVEPGERTEADDPRNP